MPKTTVIHNGINLKEWQPDGDAKFPGTNKLKVVYIGRYAEMKNIKALLRCKLPAEMDLIFIGDERGGNPDLFNEMIMYCANNKNAFYIGPKYGQEKINLLNASDAVIIPSIHEPFGIVALEALASKSVLLSSFVNGMADFLTDESAINCGTTPESIETALNTLIKLTDSQKSKYINAGLKVCQAHAWEIQAEKMAKVYDSVLN